MSLAQSSIYSRLDDILDERQGRLLVIVQNNTLNLLQLLEVQRDDNVLPFHLLAQHFFCFGGYLVNVLIIDRSFAFLHTQVSDAQVLETGESCVLE